MLLPIFLFFAIILGIVIVTEIAAMAVFYSLIIGIFVYKSLDFNGLKKVLIDSAKGTTIVMALVCCANIFTWVFIRGNIPLLIAKAVLSLGLPNILVH